jgi:DeoR family glycerol-3-phosphate regulon repressor
MTCYTRRMPVAPLDRHDRIVAAVAARGFATIEALAQQLGVSAQTVRRDVIALDRAGRLQRFHGGAGMPAADGGAVRLSGQTRQRVAADGKQAIGQAAAALASVGSTVFIDVGTTAEAVARALAEEPGCAVVTNSLRVAGLLAGRQGFALHVPGGTVRGSDGSLVGAATLAGVAEFRFDLAVIGCSGFDHDGAPMDFDLDKIEVKRAAIARASASIIVADAGKHARAALARIAPAGRFRHLVTDAAPPPALAAAFAEAGLGVLLARPGAAAA